MITTTSAASNRFLACWKKQRGFCPQVFAVQMCASLQTCVQTFGSGSSGKSLNVPSIVVRAQSASRARSACSVVLKSSFAFWIARCESARTKIILPAFHQRGLEFDRENFFHDRNVFVQELLLQVDRVRRDDRLFLFLEGEKHRRHEVGERFADTGAGFDDEMALLFERLRDRRGHRLLFRAIFEIARFREQAVLCENRPHPLDKIAAEGIFERNHAREVTREIRISKSETSPNAR